MAFGILILACLGLIIYRIYKWMIYKPDNFPPGPPRLPLVGSYPYLLLLNYYHVHKGIEWLCKYYKTDVVGFYAARFPAIITNTAELAKKSLNNQDLDGKPIFLLTRMRDPDFETRGIFFTEGPFWHEQRRYLLRNLREYGFGRRFEDLEMEINDEITNFISLLKNGPKYGYEKKYLQDGKALLPNIFFGLFANFFFKVLLNERLPREKLHLLYEAAEHNYSASLKSDDWGRMFSYIEWWAKLFPNWSDYNSLRESFEKLYACMKAIVDDQYKTFDRNHERHFLDLYFKKIEDTKNDEQSSFHYKQLVFMCADVFAPALTVNSLVVQFMIQRFYLQPEILKKCQDEIDNVVGEGRLPNLNDRINLHYVEATIRESLRHETLIPSGLPHRATVDTKFMGYDIPKGTVVYSSLHGSHTDPKVWDAPELFKPERFLDENGRFSIKLDKSLPFGAGRRLCAGETFSRNTLFLVITAIIQQFDIKVPEGERMPSTTETRTGLTRSTPQYWLKFVAR